MRLTFGFPDGNKIVVWRCRPCPPWASGERMGGYIGGFFGFGGRRVLLYFKRAVWAGELVAIWRVRPRKRIYPPPPDPPTPM